MHELSIVMSVVDIARDQAISHNASKVDKIELEIGSLAGVEMAAFTFAWKAGVQNTVLEKAERIIHHIPARAKCMSCQHEFEMMELYSPCPNCGDYFNEVIQGRELRVKSLIVS